MAIFDKLLNKIESLRVVIRPSREEYLKYIFEHACRELDLDYGPSSAKYSLVPIYMKSLLNKDIESIKLITIHLI